MNLQDLYDVTIIGGGPAGLYSAFYSGLREMKTKMIEFQPHLGGKLNVYPEKMIWDIGGLPPTPGAQVREQLIAQGLTFSPEVFLNEKIISIKKNESGIFILKTSFGQEHYSKTVIAAVGSGILSPQKLEIEGAERFEISNLHYTVKALQYFKNKTVLISGGGNSAIDWALELEHVAEKIYITYRKEQLSGHEAQIKQLESSSVICLPNTSMTKLVSCSNQEVIEKVEIKNNQTNETTELKIDEVIINHGYERDATLFENSNIPIRLEEKQYIAGNVNGQSSVPGFYAAGDIVNHEGKVSLIAGAFHDAIHAVNSAKQYIQPDASKSGMVSSHHELFKERNRKIIQQTLQKGQ